MTFSTPSVPDVPRDDSAPRAELSVVIVNYNGWEDAGGLVRALSASPEVAGGRAEILVVDNASPRPMPDDFLPLPPGARFLPRRDNGGFAVGVNEGWRASDAPWLLVLNPDVVAEPEFIGLVLDRIAQFSERPEGPPGLVGFGLRNEDGTPQPSVGALPSLSRTIWEQVIPRSRRKYQPDWLVRPGPVAWVTGACVLMNARMLDAVGGMDEDFFLYYEEVALCRSAVKAGWSVEFDPTIAVVHLHPLQNRAISPKMRVITRHSRLLYFRKHLPRSQFLGLCALVAAEARVRELGARLTGDVESRRAWRMIGWVTRELRRGGLINGSRIRELAERPTIDPTRRGRTEPTEWGSVPRTQSEDSR